ncbi:MAG: AAC(3) family N-acetyltransferase [Anaeroplasma sp.]
MILDNLINDLKEMNLSPTDTVMVHSSCKSIGYDANDILDSLMEYFKDGLLILPTHTWKTINADNPIFNPNKEPACVGILPNLFMKRKNVYRSLHPTHSVAAYGKNAKEFIAGEEYNNTPCTPGGVYDRLRKENAKILLIGVGNERNTFIHSIEEVLNVNNRLSPLPMNLKIVKDDKLIEAYVRRHYNEKQPHISLDFVKLDKALLYLNAMTEHNFGKAHVYLCDANKTFNVVRYILRKNPEIIVEDEQIPDNLWINFNQHI